MMHCYISIVNKCHSACHNSCFESFEETLETSRFIVGFASQSVFVKLNQIYREEFVASVCSVLLSPLRSSSLFSPFIIHPLFPFHFPNLTPSPSFPSLAVVVTHLPVLPLSPRFPLHLPLTSVPPLTGRTVGCSSLQSAAANTPTLPIHHPLPLLLLLVIILMIILITIIIIMIIIKILMIILIKIIILMIILMIILQLYPYITLSFSYSPAHDNTVFFVLLLREKHPKKLWG